ncbi:tellurite resistance TerB family protein [Allohahella marinimesophila]|uniref:Tellurite resistance TerB family protein n=1 Tax=Allohahella marinimesophila TaxID=1054972 RepID=A0ABP7NU34_9GAMM
MNAKMILGQLMKQASKAQSQGSYNKQGHGQDRHQNSVGDFDLGKIVGGLASQFGGGSNQSRGQSSSGIDMKSILGGGALGMLFGSKRGRSMGGKALKYGALAGVGALAWKAYQNYQSSEATGQGAQGAGSPQQGEPWENLQGVAQERRGQEILQAMIMAARADGHIDANERAQLGQEIEKLGADAELHAWVQRQFEAPLDAELLAREADSPQAAREIYVVSVAMVDEQNPMERAWLTQLASALKLEPALAAELERQVQNAAGV